MNDNQIAIYCEAIRDTTIRQFYKIQNQRKEISMLHKKCKSQQAEIEKLTADLKTTENIIKNNFLQKAGLDIDPLAEFKAEAVKEFAERLKKKAYLNDDLAGLNYMVVDVDDIDNLVKEMVGDDNG